MSRIPTKKIDGDVTIARHVTAGGNATIDGSVQINHNIKIKGWLDAPNVATPMKGLFSSEERLKAAYDDLREGWYALVHTGNGQAGCWVVQDGKWKNTGDTVAITQGASIADFMNEVNTAIEAEAQDRYQGDADLNAKILQEVADRKTADDAESAARITADNNLSTLINAEIADRVSDVEDLSNRIDAEKSARETADANLSGRIDDEVTARTTADDALDKGKEKRRKVYSFQLVDKLTTSSTHADIQKAFTTHFNDDSLIGVGGTGTSIKDVIAIPGAGDRLVDVWNKLTIYLDDQQQRAVITSVRQYETETSGVVGRIKKYDITYSDGIVSKTITLDAQNADAWKITSVVTFDAKTEIKNLKEVLQDDVSEEATTRANADNALSERIDAEATTRANADNDLSKRIGAEATARANVDANLSNRIEAEVTEREAAENELASRITDEMNVRSTAIQRLDNLLSEETQARITVDDNLAGLIDDTKSYLNIRIDEEAQTRLTEDNKKKNKDFVMRMAGETITTPEGFEFSLIDTEPQTLASVILHGECDIVLSDGIRNAYQLDHVFLSDGMPFGYKILPNNRTLNIATVIDSASSTLKLVWKFNDNAVKYDELGEKPSINGKELTGGENTAEQLGLQGALRTSADLALSDNVLSLTDMAKKRLFIDLWNECAVDFGRYNEETGYFELNGLTDLTWDDAKMIFALSAYSEYPYYACRGHYFKFSDKGHFRTNLPSICGGYTSHISNNISTYLCDYIEVLNVMQRMPFNRPPVYTNTMFTGCQSFDGYGNPKLRKVMGIIYFNASQQAVNSGYGFPKLEEINLYNISKNYKYLYNAPKLNYTSVKCMIEKRGGTNAITIWYHADVYNKILGTATDYAASGGTKEEWMALADLAASKNITLATE